MLLDILLITAVVLVTLIDLVVCMNLKGMIKNHEARIDALERGEFKDYGKGDDADGE